MQVVGGLAFVALTAGVDHTCGLTSDGTPYCWGWNGVGQLGMGSEVGPDSCPSNQVFFTCAAGPVQVQTDVRFSGLSGRGDYTCGVATDGTVHCWGRGDRGQLGTGSATGPHTCVEFEGTPCAVIPVQVAGGAPYLSVFTAAEYLWSGADPGEVAGRTCALTTGGELHCWGQGSDGVQFGASPVPFTGVGAQVAQVTLAWQYACALTTQGEALCWGTDTTGQLGRGSPGGTHPTPSPVVGDLRFSTLSATQLHTCGVTVDAHLYCWGRNGMGQLGSTSADSARPVRVREP